MSDAAEENQAGSGYLVANILIMIWERVLDRSPIRPTDNFFALGGNDFTAAQLFLEIKNATGRDLPVSTINRAPTIFSLAAALEEDVYANSSPLVQIKPGVDPCSVFISPGLGANVMELWQLGQQIQSSHAVYAIQVKDLPNSDPTGIMEDIVQSYVKEIERVQLNGPFYLVGMSFGGLIMMEIAHRFLDRGQQVALLALLDTQLPPRYWPLKTWIGIYVRRAKHHAMTLVRLPAKQAVRYAIQRLKFFVYHLRFRGGKPPELPIDIDVHPVVKKLRNAAAEALSQHTPRYYPGTVVYLKCEENVHYPEDPSSIWSDRVGRLEIYPVPGNHESLVTSNVTALAKQISIALNKVDERPAEPSQRSGV
jgi:acetoacetyl-CoA synthetase